MPPLHENSIPSEGVILGWNSRGSTTIHPTYSTCLKCCSEKWDSANMAACSLHQQLLRSEDSWLTLNLLAIACMSIR